MKKKFSQLPLSAKCQSIILGSLLGDGSLQIGKGYKNARLTVKHSVTQEQYFYWKAEQLESISSPGSVQKLKPTGYSNNKKLAFQSRCSKAVTELHTKTYEKKQKKIKQIWLNEMTDLSLAIWYLDDGSLIGGHRKAVLCTDGFDKKSVSILIKYLNTVWKLQCGLWIIKRNKTKERNYVQTEYYRIQFSVSGTKQLFQYILPWVPMCMIYKCIILYKPPPFSTTLDF